MSAALSPFLEFMHGGHGNKDGLRKQLSSRGVFSQADEFQWNSKINLKFTNIQELL